MSYSHISTRIVKIRKPHICVGCATKHNPPEQMECSVGKYDGEMQTTYFCEICKAYMTPEMWREYDSEITEGCLAEDEDYLKFRESYKTESK
jgi:hypothetical protein